MNDRLFMFLGAMLAACFCQLCQAENPWPAWRGDGSGVFTASSPDNNPLGGTTMHWTTQVEGLGYSSPVITHDKVFVTTASRADLLHWTLLDWVVVLLIGIAASLWWHGVRGQSKGGSSTEIGLFGVLGLSYLLFETVQRVPSLSAQWLAGSYGIRLWLISAFVSMTGLITAAFVARRRPVVFFMVVVVVVAALAWTGLMVPDRDDPSRLGHRWIYWVMTCAGAVFAFPRLCAGTRLPVVAIMVGGLASAWCVYILVFGHGHLAPGFWIIAGSIAMCSVSLVISIWRDAGRRPVGHGFDSVVAAVLVAASVLIFWKSNYGRLVSGMRLEVICFRLDTGSLLWRSGYLTGNLKAPHYANSFASPTPATDGRHVYAYFGAGGAACFDLEGQIVWVHENLPLDTPYGAGSSPILHDNKMIIACDSDTDSYLIALDDDSGRVAWKTKRNASRGSFGTPVLSQLHGRTQVIVAGGGQLAGYDPATGTPFWDVPLPLTEVVASSVADQGQVFVASESQIIAYVADNDSMVEAWRVEEDGPTAVSPVLTGHHVWTLSDDGVLTCFNRHDGKPLRRLDLDRGKYFSSLILSGDRLLLCSKSGMITTLGLPGLKVVSELALQEDCFASPAVCGDGVVLRTTQHLMKIGRGSARSK